MVDQDRDPKTLSPSSLNRCPRQIILKRECDYAVDPAKQWAAAMGTAIHAWIEDGAERMGKIHEDNYLTEIRLNATVTVNGVELEISGQIDLFDPQSGTITDFKTTGSFQTFDPETRSRRNKPMPSPEHTLQANCYAYLLREHGYTVNNAQIWYVRTSKEATRRLVNVELWEPDEFQQRLTEAAAPIAEWVANGTLPAAYLPDHPDYWQCNYCRVAEQCAKRVLDEEWE